MSTPILPFAVWAPGTNQNSIPANDNSLRQQILSGLVISDATAAQPGSPADGDIYIIPAAATGAAWALFDEFDLTIYSSGAWYAFAPVSGVVVNVAGVLKRWGGSAYVPVALPSYTVAGIPSATVVGQMIYVTNESGGAVPAFSDGTNFRRVTDRAIVS
jgi:hypothetical protein